MRKIFFAAFLIFVFAAAGTSFAEISKITVSNALKRIAKVGSFDRVPIKFEKDDTPDAWLEFEDNGNFNVHVTRGLMRILDNEGEIAGVLGHVIGHVQLGHYNTALQSNANNYVTGINTQSSGSAVSDTDIQEGSFTQKQEAEADSYSTGLLRKTRYSPRGLYDVLKKFQAKGYKSERAEFNSFNSYPVSPERLANVAESAGISQGIKGDSKIGMEDIADILMGR